MSGNLGVKEMLFLKMAGFLYAVSGLDSSIELDKGSWQSTHQSELLGKHIKTNKKIAFSLVDVRWWNRSILPIWDSGPQYKNTLYYDHQYCPKILQPYEYSLYLKQDGRMRCFTRWQRGWFSCCHMWYFNNLSCSSHVRMSSRHKKQSRESKRVKITSTPRWRYRLLM